MLHDNYSFDHTSPGQKLNIISQLTTNQNALSYATNIQEADNPHIFTSRDCLTDPSVKIKSSPRKGFHHQVKELS